MDVNDKNILDRIIFDLEKNEIENNLNYENLYLHNKDQISYFQRELRNNETEKEDITDCISKRPLTATRTRNTNLDPFQRMAHQLYDKKPRNITTKLKYLDSERWYQQSR